MEEGPVEIAKRGPDDWELRGGPGELGYRRLRETKLGSALSSALGN